MHYAIRCPYCGSQNIKNWEQERAYVPYTYDWDEERITPEFSCLNCSEIFGCMADNTDSLPQSHCVAFHFSVGQKSKQMKTIYFEKADSYTDLEIAIPYKDVAKKARIPLTEWQDIKDDLFNQLFILSWQTDYEEKNESEGNYWEMVLGFDDRHSYEVKGVNAYPVLYERLLELINPYLEELGFEKESISNNK